MGGLPLPNRNGSMEDVGVQRGSWGDWKKRREGILWSRCNNITKGKYFKITTKFQNYKLNYSKKDDFCLEFIFRKLE